MRSLQTAVPRDGSPRSRGRARRSAVSVGAALTLMALTLGSVEVGGQQPRVAPGGSPDTSLLQRVLATEDVRGRGPDGIAALREGVRSASPAMRGVAVRAMGRLEQPPLLDEVIGLFTDRSAAVRGEAVNASAQTARGAAGRSDVAGVVARTLTALSLAAERTENAALRGEIARAIGRLPYADSSGAARARDALESIVAAAVAGGASAGVPSSTITSGILHGIYDLARARPRMVAIGDTLLGFARRNAARGVAAGAPSTATAGDARLRRLAVLALSSSGVPMDGRLFDALARDPDGQVRRLAVAHAGGSAADSSLARRVAVGALRDASPMVRFEGVRVVRARFAAAGCPTLVPLTRDPDPAVALSAIDALGTCPDRATGIATLTPFLAPAPASGARRSNEASWHTHAHALVSVARLDPVRGEALVRRDLSHPVWQVRMYAARAAALVRDSASLRALAADPVGNVREAALDGLARTVGHAADSLLLAALASPDYQVIIAAAKGLQGTPAPRVAAAALLAALERLTTEGRENSRDARMELLARIGDVGAPSDAPRLVRFVEDFDPAIARRSAEIASRWTGATVAANPRPVVEAASDLGAVARRGEIFVRVTMAPMSGGGSFLIRLRASVVPATVSRMLRLAKAGYYDGLTFHRVEPNFVIQGGSPRMTEYVGDAAFLRDELDLASHVRGTVGISTRGRDTGDAQLFVNLIDNIRLDHQYTVVGEVVDGMAVVDSILEGDTMLSVREEARRAR